MTLKISEVLTGFVESPPIIYYKLEKALKNPENSFKDFTKIIETDPNLTDRLLKLVNSGFYGLPSKVETISHAISVVGLNQLIDLALSTEVVNKFRGISVNLINTELFWIHSLACGLAARVIAIDKKAKNPEGFFLAGLLHDIGRLVILKNLPEEAKKVHEESISKKKPLSQVETEIIGFNHDQAGKILLEEWKLPERLVEAVNHHHSPLKSEKHQVDSAIIYIADAVAYGMRLGNSGEGYNIQANPKVLKFLQLDEAFVRNLRKEIQKQINETAIHILN